MSVLERTEVTARECSIYALCEPNGRVRYVGKAVDPEARYRQHLEVGQLNRYRTHKNSWLKGLLAQGLQPDLLILDWVPLDEADEAERAHIAAQRFYGGLTNGTDGGDGGAVTDPDALARIRAAHLGSTRTAATKAQMSVSAKARCAGDAERARLRSISNGTPPVKRGEENNQARFSAEQVIAMREAVAAGEPRMVVAKRYGTSVTQVSYVVTGKTWAHVGGPLQEQKRKFLLNEEQAPDLPHLLAEGADRGDLAARYGVSKDAITSIHLRRTWRHVRAS